jgi:hypothetical protein
VGEFLNVEKISPRLSQTCNLKPPSLQPNRKQLLCIASNFYKADEVLGHARKTGSPPRQSAVLLAEERVKRATYRRYDWSKRWQQTEAELKSPFFQGEFSAWILIPL